MAENLNNENNPLNSARAVKPGLLSVDMSKFGNLTQEEASFETMDKVQNISDRLDEIKKTIDSNKDLQAMTREGFGAVLTSISRVSDNVSRSGASVRTGTDNVVRGLRDLVDGINNCFGEIRDIIRDIPRKTAENNAQRNVSDAEIVRPRETITRQRMPEIDVSSVSQIVPVVSASMNSMVRSIEMGMNNISALIVPAINNSLSSVVSGMNITPQIEYVSERTPNEGQTLVPELILNEKGNTLIDLDDSVFASNIERSLTVLSTGVMTIGSILGRTFELERAKAVREQYAQQLLLQAPKQEVRENVATEKALQISLEMPKAVKGIAEWLLGLVGLHKETISTIMTVSGWVLNSVKKLANWFLVTDLGKSIIADVRLMTYGLMRTFVRLDRFLARNVITPIRGAIVRFGGRVAAWLSTHLPKGFVDFASKTLPNFFSRFFGAIGRGFAAVFPKTAAIVSSKWAGLIKFFSKRATGALPLLGAIISGIEAIRHFMEGDYLGSVIDVISGIASFFPGLGTVISLAFAGLNMLRDFGLGKGISDSINGFITNVARTTWEFIRDSFVAIGMTIKDMWNASVSWVAEVTKPLTDGFVELYDWISGWVSVLTDTFVGTVRDAWYGLSTTFTEASKFIWNGITSLASGIYETIRYYIKDWFGIDISTVFTELYNKLSAVWTVAKAVILAVPNTVSGYWQQIKGYVSETWEKFKTDFTNLKNAVISGLTLAGALASKMWDDFTSPIKKAWNSFIEGSVSLGNRIKGWFTDFGKGIENIVVWLENIDPWEEIENGIKKLGDLLRAIPNALKRVYNNAIDAIPGASKLFSKYELPNENVASEPPAPEEVSLTSMVSNSAEIGRNIAIHERTLKELADAKKELTGTSSIFSPYQVEALKSKVWELEQRSEREEKILNTYYGKDAWKDLKGTAQTKAEAPAVSGIPTTAKEKIEMERAIHKQIAKERAEHIDEINVLNRQMEEAYNSDWGNTRVSGTVQAGTVMHAQASALPEIKAEAPEISAQPMEMQRMEPTTVTPNISVLPMEPTTVTPNVSVLPSVPVQVPAEKMSEVTQPPSIEGMKISVAVPQQPVTNKNAEMLVSMMEKQIAENGKTLGKCAQAFNDATISLGMASERGHAYQKIAQLDKNKNFEDITSQYKTAEDLKNLPRGAVVVWDKSAEKEYGHVSVALGDGREISDHVQNQITGADSKGRRYGAYHVYMPKSDVSAVAEEKGLFAKIGDSVSNWFNGENDNEDAALRENTEAIKANTNASKEQGGISKLLTGALDIMTKGLQKGAPGAGAALMEAENLLFGNSDSILAAKSKGPLVVSSLSMIGEGSEKQFVSYAEAEDDNEPVESPLPQAEANRRAEEERQRELSQRPVTVVAPTNNNVSESTVPQPNMNDAYIDDIRLLAINQGLA